MTTGSAYDPRPPMAVRIVRAGGRTTSMRASRLCRTGLAPFSQAQAAMIAAVLLLLLTSSAVLAPWIAPYNPDHSDFSAFNAAPTGAHPMGADFAGRDVLSRVLLAADLAADRFFLNDHRDHLRHHSWRGRRLLRRLDRQCDHAFDDVVLSFSAYCYCSCSRPSSPESRARRIS